MAETFELTLSIDRADAEPESGDRGVYAEPVLVDGVAATFIDDEGRVLLAPEPIGAE